MGRHDGVPNRIRGVSGGAPAKRERRPTRTRGSRRRSPSTDCSRPAGPTSRNGQAGWVEVGVLVDDSSARGQLAEGGDGRDGRRSHQPPSCGSCFRGVTSGSPVDSPTCSAC
jgi:hypothetical protein